MHVKVKGLKFLTHLNDNFCTLITRKHCYIKPLLRTENRNQYSYQNVFADTIAANWVD